AFPPRIPSFFDVKKNATRCYFNNGKTSTEEYASLDVYAEADIVRTHAIHCPTAARRHAFMASYVGGTTLESYRPKYPDIRPTYVFPRGPPDNSGWDPLSGLDQSAYRREREELYGAVRKKNFRPTVEFLFEASYDWQTEEGKDVIDKFVSLCSAVLDGIKQEAGTYDVVCDAYKRVFEDIVSNAHFENWEFRPEKGNILVTPA
ncbi:hypothetical protein FOZ61_006740, partial [Perkinsus olseni]